ncbi:hypothetical protein QTP88_004040 [Uroleucon formosanum]
MSDEKLINLNLKIFKLTDIYLLKKPDLISLCTSKKLKNTGTVENLRSRLSKYYKRVAELDDIEDTLTEKEKNTILTESLNNKIEINELLAEYDLAGDSNTADTFLENLESIKTHWSWEELKNEFLKEFQPIGHAILLKTKLENRKQEDIGNLWRQVEKNMKEEDICTYILKGLKINSRGPPGFNEYTEILNKQIMQVGKYSKDRVEELSAKIDQLTNSIKKVNFKNRNDRYYDKSVREMTVTTEILIDKMTGMTEIKIVIDLTLGIDKRGIKTIMKRKPGMTDIRIEVEITVEIGIIIMTIREMNRKEEVIDQGGDLFRSLEGAKYYTCLDLAQGYFQLPIKKEDQYKTAFITDFGLYNFKRIPQGFKNSGPIFQRVINNIFSDYLYRTMIAYLDDICCFGNTFEEALTRLEEIFIRIEEAGLKLKTNKCTILGFEIELLGHKVSNLGVKPLEKNIKAITQFPIPTKVKDVRAFVGLTSYYRKYIKNFAKIASPLTDLTKKDNKFHWNKSQDIAFNTLKNAIITAPVLAHFEDEYPVFVTTDASLEGLSGILEQSDNNGKRHPIAYASRKLKGGEKNFTTTELEMSAVMFAVNYFKEYLLGRKVTVFSDHSSLQYYQTMKNPSSRITKFIFKLLEFDIEIKHRPGLCNQAADCLSRYPVNTLLVKDILEVNNKEDPNFDSLNLEKLKENQSKDEFCKGIISAINGNNNSKFKRKSRQFLIKDDILFFKNWSPNGIKKLIVVPKTLINVILKSYHESVLSAHFSITKTLTKLKQKYYWPTIIRDTTHFIKTCISCQMIKKPTGKSNGLLQPIPLLSGKPMQRLTFDYLGPLPTSRGKKYLIVATCNATKMAFAKAVTNADGAATIDFLMDLITSYGVPKYFCSDRGTHFKNKEVGYACKKLGITQIFSSACHPQTQGMTERMNKIICNSLSHYVNENQKDWSLYYKMIVFAYNTSPSSRLKVSPFYLLHGMEASQPIDNKLTTEEDELFDLAKALNQLQNVRDTIPKIIEKEQAVQKKHYDLSQKNIHFEPGQKVLIKFDFNEKDKTKKLGYKYRGPFTIIEKLSDVNYRVDLILKGKKTIDTFHVNRIKPYHERPT